MNKDLQVILSACEKPIILAPDDVPIDDLYTICDNQGNNLPFDLQIPPSDSSITENLMLNDVAATQTVQPVAGLQQPTKAFITVDNTNLSNITTLVLNGDSKLSCKVCGKHFTREENLTFHEQTHNNSDLFHCNTCSKSFSTYESLIGHLASHQKNASDDPQEALEECELCGKYFHAACIVEHEKGYKNQVLFNCRFCEQSFCKKGLLIYHLKLHSAEEGNSEKHGVRECDICLKKNEDSNLKKRPAADEGRKPEGPPTLEVQPQNSMCSKKPRQMPVLKPQVHRNLSKAQTDMNAAEGKPQNRNEDAIIISDDENDVTCDKLKSPYRQRRLNFRSYSGCEICLKTFSNSKMLLDHSKEHWELQCIDCGKYFSSIHEMLQHEELFHRIQCFTCKKCDKNITLKSNFIEHILSHNLSLLQVCKVCYLYLYQNYTKYLARFQLFTVTKPFQCDICCKILQTANVKDLQCNLCSKQFQSESLLKEHCEAKYLTNVKCCECNKYFHSVHDFNVHSVLARNNCVISHKRHLFTNQSDFNCLKCFMEFLTPEKLLEHCLRSQHYKCGNCDVTFFDWENYNSHLVLYPVVPCPGCKSFILGEISLEKHKHRCPLISCITMQPLGNFDYSKNLLCIECNATFSKKECLIEHIIFLH